MNQYLIYIAISSLTIASPGPGVVLTLSNTINYGTKRAVLGFTGIASGMGILAALAASSVGLIASQTPSILSVVKITGAIYLTYLGIRLLTKKSKATIAADSTDSTNVREYIGGFFQGL